MKRMKKILLCNILACLMLVQISLVSAYEFVEPGNENYVKWHRKEIYELVDLYYDAVGSNARGNNFTISNYTGACSVVTVKSGSHAGTYPLEEYVAGVVKAEIGGAHRYPEVLKAQAIAARSYLIATKGGSGGCIVDSSQGYQVFHKLNQSNQYDQLYIAAAQATAGQVVMRDGKVARTHYVSLPHPNWYYESNSQLHVKMQKFSDDKNTSWTWVGPSYNTVTTPIGGYTKSRDPNHNWGMSQVIAVYLASKGDNYQQIIDTFYGDSSTSIGKSTDGDYVGKTEFVTGSFGEIRYWNQKDFGSYYYSKDAKKPEYGKIGNYATIESHGCGPTSLAMIFSSFANKDITPIAVTQELCQIGGCTATGSIWSTLATLAQKYGYKTEFVSRNNPDKVAAALASGKSLVVAYMGKGIFTDGGHYIVLTGVRNDGYVSVADSNSRERTSQRWFLFNTVLEQTHPVTNQPFLVITK